MSLGQERFIFLGSRLGDSLLMNCIEYNEQDALPDGTNPLKHDLNYSLPRFFNYFLLKATQGTGLRALEGEEGDEDERGAALVDTRLYDEGPRDREQSVYYPQNQSSPFMVRPRQLKTYKFRVCDSLLNIGPISDFVVGESFDLASLSMSVSYSHPFDTFLLSRLFYPLRCCCLFAYRSSSQRGALS